MLRCDGVDRRTFLKVGALGGISLSTLLRAQAAAPGTSAPAKACILIWLDGGPSHLDTFDLKPEAPGEVRGDFKPIETAVAGIRICEHLPRIAREMREIGLIRSLTHELGDHSAGSHYLLTGHRPSPVLEFPSMGSIASLELGRGGALPPYVAIPDAVRYAGPGYLAGIHAPFAVGGDPSRPEFRVRDLAPAAGVAAERVPLRQRLLQEVNELARAVDRTEGVNARNADLARAAALTTSPNARGAFDISQEAAGVRERYGRGRLGTGCLLARRLVEGGTPFVTVVDVGWDTHQQISRALPDSLFPGSGKLPSLDRAYSTLLADLRERGLLASTLVVMMGEFGRTPKLNALAGRDHWPRAAFALLAGAGIRGGQVVGATDPHGESPADRPVSPEDIACTVFDRLGIDPRRELHTRDGRPIKLVDGGQAIRELV